MVDNVHDMHSVTGTREGGTMHEVTLDTGEKVMAADSMEEALEIWFPSFGKSMYEAITASYETPKKAVYVIRMSNGTIKIGVSQDIETRLRTLANTSGMEIVESYHTEYVEPKTAFKVEHLCHKKFNGSRKRGEYFGISFKDACKAVNECLKERMADDESNRSR